MEAWLTTGDPIDPLDLSSLLPPPEPFSFATQPGPVNQVSQRIARHVSLFMYRNSFIEQFGFAIPTRNVIQALCAFGPLVEIDAGTGYWSKLISQSGVDILAYDQHQLGRPLSRTDRYGRDAVRYEVGKWFPTTRLLPGRVLARHPDRTALFCWPAMQGWAGKALSRHLPRTVAYIGEFGGCTGDPLFHSTLESKYHEINHIGLCNFPGVKDNLTFWERQ